MSDELAELRNLTAALRAHLEWQRDTGATGLPAASADVARERGAPSADLAPPAPTLADRPEAGAGRYEDARRGQPRGGMPPDLVQPTREKERPREAPAAAVPRVVLPPGERSAALQVIQAEVVACEACGLHQTRTQTVFARGSGASGVCFVGEGPGAEEDAQGLPFVGKAGQLLDKMIVAMGLEPAEVYVANIVKCRPPDNRKPSPDEMHACRGYLERQLEAMDPQVIVALGATAVQGLLGTSLGITRLRGNWKLYQGRIAVMPTFHPAYLLRVPKAKRDVWEDLKAVLRHLGRAVPETKSS
jgi:DNA polymerase